MRRIILASASPRRKELLKQLGLEFEVAPSEYPEDLVKKLPPRTIVRRLSIEKAKAVAPLYPDSIIIAADTIGVIGGKVIGKPKTIAEAKAMLRLLSGKTHLVITGVTILDTADGCSSTGVVTTAVTFRKLTKSDIDAYVATGEPLDKAGAYAIQGLGAVLVKEIRGDYFNVMGLPIGEVAAKLKKFGIDILSEKH